MKLSKNFLHIIFTTLFAALALSFIDGYFSPDYIYKSIIKLLFLILLPLTYFIRYKSEYYRLKSIFRFKLKNIKSAILLAISLFVFILAAYFIASGFIDLNQIKTALINNINVNKDNFIFVALYISFINSFLEEFFFRAYAFMMLKEHSSRRFAYIYSASIFAVYHLGMTSGWFNPIIFVLSFAGLFIGACIFNYLNERTDSIYPSWIVHMFANFAINTIGLILFGII